MLLISENLLIKYLLLNDELKLDEFINKKLFTVADTPLTYRQVNSLDTDNLLTNDRAKKQGWRKFSFKELVYVLIVHELKQFGLKHEQLKSLWECFFKEPTKSEKRTVAKIELNKGIGEIAIGCIFEQVEITLVLDSRGEVIFYDPIHYLLFSGKPSLQIKLNDIVNELLKKIGKEQIPIKWSVQEEALYGKEYRLTTKEEELLTIIRNRDYSSIRVKKKDGEIALVYAEKIRDGSNGTTTQDLIEMLNTKDFQDISIIKRDGKIVNYKIEETIKL